MILHPKTSNRHSFAGVSLVEIVLTVVAIGVLASISVLAVSNISQNTQSQKLESDVTHLNSAITMYLANGGDLSGVSEPNDVLNRLKSTRSKADRARHVGAPSGRMLDTRVAAVEVPENSWKRRAVYDPSASRFHTTDSGIGVEFILDEALAEALPAIESRSHDTFQYAEHSGWVWDHTSTNNPNAPNGPSAFFTNPYVEDSTTATPNPPAPEPPTTTGGGSSGPPPPPPPPKPPKLPTPNFDKNGGSHPEGDFPLVVTITNVPSPADADPICKIGSGTWEPYTGSITVEMNTTIRAQFVSKNPENYRDSSERSAYYYPVPESLSGQVDGNFHSPSGGANLSYEISGSGDRFTHGDPIFMLDGEPIHSGDPNVLEFGAQSFSEIPPGASFKLGTLTYHNGNSYYDSHATNVKLQIVINLTERGETIGFDLDLDLVNTPNDPDDPQASADYVKITNLQQNIPLQINGVNYKIALGFGATDSFGFSSQSQFHVYEGATGQGELLGTFLPN